MEQVREGKSDHELSFISTVGYIPQSVWEKGPWARGNICLDSARVIGQRLGHRGCVKSGRRIGTQ